MTHHVNRHQRKTGIGSEVPPMPWNWTKYSKGEAQAPVTLNYDTYDVDGDKNPQNDILLPYPHAVQVPGFELLVALISIIAVVLILKYRKKDRRN